MGETGILSTLAALLAEAVLAQGRDAEAEELTRASEHAAAADDAASQIAWRRIRALALSRRGAHGEATTLAHDAVERAVETDFLVAHADALVALGEVLQAGGDVTGSNARRAEAGRLYEVKGVRAGAAAGSVFVPE